MSNVMFGWPIFSDSGPLYSPTLSGGSWVAGLPLTNLKDRRLHKVARSSTDAVADTVFTCDLGVARAVRTLALVNHNLSSAGKVRVRGFTTVPILDSSPTGKDTFAAGWSANGTPTRTANDYECDDGVFLDLIDDDDAAVAEGYTRTVTFTGDGQKIVAFRVRQGTASSSVVRILDSTAPADRLRVGIAWSGGAPSLTIGTGTLISSTSLGDGAYRIVMLTSAVTAANTNSLGVFAAYNVAGDVALTGTTHFGDVMAWDAATDQLVYDTGRTDALPAGTDAESRAGWNPTWAVIPGAAQTARYWRCNIDDTTNADTYVEAGRLVIAGAYQPTYNMSNGATLRWEDLSEVTDTDGGAVLVRERAKRRHGELLIENLSESEVHGTPLTMEQVAGITGQLFFVFDPADTTLLWRRSFLARLRELSPIEYPHPTFHAKPFAVVEEL